MSKPNGLYIFMAAAAAAKCNAAYGSSYDFTNNNETANKIFNSDLFE